MPAGKAGGAAGTAPPALECVGLMTNPGKGVPGGDVSVYLTMKGENVAIDDGAWGAP
jgi:hypothetical protein